MRGRLIGALVVLAAVLVGADRVVDHELETGIARGVASADGVVSGAAAGLGDVKAAVGGFPVLTQLAAGRLDAVTVRVPGYTASSGDVSLTIQDITADLTGVSTGSPRVAGSLRASGVLTADALASAASDAGLAGTVSVGPDGVALSGEILGMEVSASLALSVDEGGRGLLLAPVSVLVGGRELPVDATGASPLPTVTLPLDALPAGVVLHSVTPSDGRLAVVLTGTDVDLEAAAAGP